MVQDLKACRFDPSVLTCKEGQNSACLPAAKTQGLRRLFDSTRNSKGEALYSAWPYDPGIAAPGWRAWRLGTPGVLPYNARNLTLIPGSLAYDFFSPPEKITDVLAFVRDFDFDRDPPKLARTVDGYEPGLSFETATSVELEAFRARGGKMVFTHGGADPIFSPLDTMAYMDRLRDRFSDADSFARLFLVPGMNHCAGGPSTDKFDALAALDAWVEDGKAPDTILATARATPDVPWPGRTRPLCAYPKVATYKGSGSLEEAASFTCK
jgi:feruloyl esterase